MADKIITYPYFSDGEVLTADNLNTMVKYLAGQPRTVCKDLVGSGIIRGLMVNFSSGVLTIFPGSAIFPDGSVLEIREECKYPYLYLDEGALFFSDVEIEGKNSITMNSIDDYEIVLVKFDKESRTVCNQISCDLNHRTVYEVIQPRLVSRKDLRRFTYKQSGASMRVRFNAVKDIHANMNYSALMCKISGCFNANRDTLCSAMATALEGFGIFFKLNKSTDTYYVDDVKSSFRMESVVRGWKEIVHNYVNALSKLHKLNNRGKGTVVIPYYFLDFLQDVKSAYAEYCACSQWYVLRHDTFYDDSVLKGNELVLTGAGYRQPFHPVERGAGSANDALILSRHISRLSMMVIGFIGFKYDRSFKAANVRLVPFRAGSSLNDRPIPFYYSNAGELGKVWKAGEPWAGVPESTPLEEAGGTGMHFSLQGVYDMRVATAEDALNGLIREYNLPLEVKRVDIKNIVMHNDRRHPKVGKNYYRTLLSWLNQSELNALEAFDIENVPDPMPCKYRLTKHKMERKETMDTKKSLVRISSISGISKILENADNNMVVDSSDMDTIRDALSPVTAHRFKLFLKYSHDMTLRNMFYDKKNPVRTWYSTKMLTWANRSIASFIKFKDFFINAYRPEYRHCNIRSVREFGTINLVCYKGNVVFPFYSDKMDD